MHTRGHTLRRESKLMAAGQPGRLVTYSRQVKEVEDQLVAGFRLQSVGAFFLLRS